jgi:hypothetical protein
MKKEIGKLPCEVVIFFRYCTFFLCHLIMTYFGTLLQSYINEFEIDIKICFF